MPRKVQKSSFGSDNNQVLGNSIGVASDGVTALGNTENGVKLDNLAESNWIGEWLQGSKPFTNIESTGNIISGNGQDGVLLTLAAFAPTNANYIEGNSIGIGGDGTTKVPNGQNGVEINQVVGVVVSGNVISGNNWNGLAITGDTQNNVVIATQTAVTHNLIGTNAAGTATVGNGQNGIYIYLADQNTIGGTTGAPTDPTVPSNVISGNGWYGIEIGGSSNLVVNNYIGTNVNGNEDVSNGTGGINIG